MRTTGWRSYSRFIISAWKAPASCHPKPVKGNMTTRQTSTSSKLQAQLKKKAIIEVLQLLSHLNATNKSNAATAWHQKGAQGTKRCTKGDHRESKGSQKVKERATKRSKGTQKDREVRSPNGARLGEREWPTKSGPRLTKGGARGPQKEPQKDKTATKRQQNRTYGHKKIRDR